MNIFRTLILVVFFLKWLITDSNIYVNFITVKTGSNPTICKKVALLQGYRWDGP